MPVMGRIAATTTVTEKVAAPGGIPGVLKEAAVAFDIAEACPTDVRGHESVGTESAGFWDEPGEGPKPDIEARHLY